MNRYKVPRIVFVNKMDRVGADFYKCIGDIKQKLENKVHPLFLPIGRESEFNGLIDIVNENAYIYDLNDKLGMKFHTTDVPESYTKLFKQYRESLIEYLADIDDDVAEVYLNNTWENVESGFLKKRIRKHVLSRSLVLAMPGSSFKNKGVQMLLDSIVDYLPSPADLKPVALYEKNEVNSYLSFSDSCTVGLVFKIWTDPFVGKLIFYRLYSGCLKKGSLLYNPRTKKKEKVTRIIIMKADTKEDVDIVYSGNICALVGVRDVITGDTLSDLSDDFVLEPPSFPDPVISMSIEPLTKFDREKLSLSLKKLSEEDPTFKVKSNYETGQTLISGMGELHLDIIKDRLLREFKIKAISGKPQIAFKEAITKDSEGEGKYIKQSGGRGQYGHVLLTLQLGERGSGVKVFNKITGGSIPKEYIKPVFEGINSALKEGILLGYPVTDVTVSINDGSFHEVDSSELAFKLAGILAVKNALSKANCILLEPIMKVDVFTPSEFQGDLIADISRRRGSIDKINTESNSVGIRSFIPLENMFGYSTDLRSLSKGRANYSMVPSHFSKSPKTLT